jgi:hypothetical protein
MLLKRTHSRDIKERKTGVLRECRAQKKIDNLLEGDMVEIPF